jgi:hypothetical protein
VTAAASLEISLRIGQRVRHRDFHGKRVTGVVCGLSVDSEGALHADISLDEPIVIPPLNDADREIRIYNQHVPAHELAPFDEREELIGELRQALEGLMALESRGRVMPIGREWDAARAAIAKAGGAA